MYNNYKDYRPYKVYDGKYSWPNCYGTLEEAESCKKANPGSKVTFKGREILNGQIAITGFDGKREWIAFKGN